MQITITIPTQKADQIKTLLTLELSNPNQLNGEDVNWFYQEIYNQLKDKLAE
ncbi:MAG: hypothetical protein JRD89_02110 [Deltaproteobacteria bacterium]|nr:hypothetical protein [Deltaproteobacteria bacterium]